MGFSRLVYWSGLTVPPPGDHILSELSTMTHRSWVAQNGMAHSFIELRKPLQQGFSIMWTENFQMFKLGLEKAEEPEIKLLTSAGSQRKQGNFRKTSTSVSSSTPQPLTVWTIINCGKLFKRWEYQTILPVSWETCMRVKKQLVEPCMDQLTGSRLRKEYDKAYLLSPCLYNL